MSIKIILAATCLMSCSGLPAMALDSDVSTTSTLAPDAVWKKVGDFCGIAKWHPIIEKCTLSADGKERVLMAKGGATATERVEAWDDSARSYTYTIIGGNLPVANYHSTLSVKADAKGSVIRWVGKYDAKGAPDADAKKLIDTIYDSGEKALAQP